jgi:hypothetical protein
LDGGRASPDFSRELNPELRCCVRHGRKHSKRTGAPSFASFCEGWDPRQCALRFVVSHPCRKNTGKDPEFPTARHQPWLLVRLPIRKAALSLLTPPSLTGNRGDGAPADWLHFPLRSFKRILSISQGLHTQVCAYLDRAAAKVNRKAPAIFVVDVFLVPKKGLEPPHPCEYMDLNHARLPIPPLRHDRIQRDRLDRQQPLVYKSRPRCQTRAASPQANHLSGTWTAIASNCAR